jgi:hypothetical protein
MRSRFHITKYFLNYPSLSMHSMVYSLCTENVVKQRLHTQSHTSGPTRTEQVLLNRVHKSPCVVHMYLCAY